MEVSLLDQSFWDPASRDAERFVLSNDPEPFDLAPASASGATAASAPSSGVKSWARAQP
jgi:hypothetical protein